MRNQELWQPGKFIYRNGRLTASRDSGQLHPGSRILADALARCFEVHISLHAHDRLIDLGCGNVPLFAAYRTAVDVIVCTDCEQASASKAYRDFTCDLTAPLPIRSCNFDTIILADVLEHIPTPQALWFEMARILKPGGKLLVSVPFYYGIHDAPHDYFRYTAFALRRFAQEAGFSLLVLEPLGGSPEILADLFAKHAQAVPRVGPFIAAVIHRLITLLLKTTLIQWLSRKTSPFFPFGYFLVAQKIRRE